MQFDQVIEPTTPAPSIVSLAALVDKYGSPIGVRIVREEEPLAGEVAIYKLEVSRATDAMGQPVWTPFTSYASEQAVIDYLLSRIFSDAISPEVA